MYERSFNHLMMTEITSFRSDRSSSIILDSAYALFTSQGYAATSMRQIAEKAGLALGSIYNHFSSKEAIFEAIILTRHPFFKILKVIKETRGVSMDEYLQNAAQKLVDELGQKPEYFNLLLTEMVEFKARHVPLIFAKVTPDIFAITKQIQTFRPDLRPIPTLLIFRAFIGLFISYYITDLFMKGLMPPEMQENALKVFVEIFLNGVKNPDVSASSAALNSSTTEKL